jgi:transcriptional regulator with XRE-family HTH domain
MLTEIKSQKENCLNCKFWRKIKDISCSDDEELFEGDFPGECRRKAPSPLSWEFMESTEHEVGLVFATWPTTFDNNYCGDFIRSLESKVEESYEERVINREDILKFFKDHPSWGKWGFFAEIARKSGYNNSYVAKALTGRVEPGLLFIKAVADAFGIKKPEVNNVVEEVKPISYMDEDLNHIVSVFKSQKLWGKRGLFANIAGQTGFTPAYVGQVFSGKKKPAKKFMLAVCGAYNILMPKEKCLRTKTPQRVIDLLKDEIPAKISRNKFCI